MMPFLIVAALIGFFGLFFIVFNGALAIFGWSALASRFRTQQAPDGRMRFLSGQSLAAGNAFVGPTYNGSIHIWIGDEGFFMRPMKLFQLFHPMLFIRWSDIESVVKTHVLGMEQITVALRGVDTPIRTKGQFASAILGHPLAQSVSA